MSLFAELAEVENRFAALEIETLRTSYIRSKPVYDDRARLTKQVPDFWPTVLTSDDVPPIIESFITPNYDLHALGSITHIDIKRFEVDDDPEHGDPRSFTLIFEFKDNIYFEDVVLEKSFWYRRSKDGWAGLVSEPVRPRWKEQNMNTEYRTLIEDLKAAFEEARSFFSFFAYCGRNITAEESATATEDQLNRRESNLEGRLLEVEQEAQEGDLNALIHGITQSDEANDDDDPLAHEIFPEGEELALAICDDLVPNALKYFAQASERDTSESEVGDVDEFDGDESDVSIGAAEPPPKRKKRF